jgi:pyrroline-5-carboxylate reductase
MQSPLDPWRLAVLGCGTLGEAVVGGLIAADAGWCARVTATARRAERCERLHRGHGIAATSDNRAAVAGSDVVLLCLKPHGALDLVADLADVLAGKLLISVCAGITTDALHRVAPDAVIVRAMPNTPARVRAGMTAITRGPLAGDDHVAVARAIFEPTGRVRELEEKHFDVVTGLSGSGPAFAFVILEALADGGVMMGLPRDAAFELAAQTLLGSAQLMLESGAHPAALKDEVTTPAGCTIAGLLTLEDRGIRSTLARAIQEATQVARTLGSGGAHGGD